ncbi:MAG: hypothetical protein J2P32_16630 [Actinobacteria bacterium]|nr:hypothetical protein [Actinomycetota bacterium]
MSGTGPPGQGRADRGRESRGRPGPPPANPGTGWSVLSYLIAGMALYGAIGWLIGRWTHITVLFPVGMIAGLGFGITLVILRFRAR